MENILQHSFRYGRETVMVNQFTDEKYFFTDGEKETRTKEK